MTTERKRIWGWMAYDWASQPFFTLGLTFVFAPLFGSVLAEYLVGQGLSSEAADAQAQARWARMLWITGAITAVTAPIAGAIADRTGRRVPWVAAFSAILAISAWNLWHLDPAGTNWLPILTLFAIAFFSAEMSLMFINAQLPSLGSEDDVGAIGGSGLAFGYVGGVISLLVMFFFFYVLDAEDGKTLLGLPPAFGLDPFLLEDRLVVGPFIAIWLAVFLVPYFLWVKEPTKKNKTGRVWDFWPELKQTLKGVFKRPSLAAYLGSSMLYRDAMNALYSFGGFYATFVLEWPLIEVALFGIISAISAAIITFFGGKCDVRFGPKPVIVTTIVILILVCTTIVGMSRVSVFGIPLPEGSNLPDYVMYMCGVLIGGMGGVLFSASRTMMIRHADPEKPAEAFGLFALSGKATAFLAPALIELFTTLTGSARFGISPVILLFLGGLVLLTWVNKNGDREIWSETT